MTTLRAIFRVNEDGSKTRVRMSELKVGETFELYEDDGLLLHTAVAVGIPTETKGVWGINATIKEQE